MSVSELLRWVVLLLTLLALLAGLVYYHAPVAAVRVADTEGVRPRAEAAAAVRIGEVFRQSAPLPEVSAAAAWPGFRGAGRDNILPAAAVAGTDWAAAPRVRWRRPLGEGYAAPVIWRGLVYLLDYDEEESADSLLCLELASGQELWRRAYRLPIRRNHGKSRTVPVVADGAVVTFGPLGQVMAADALSGDLLWSLDLVRDFGSQIPQWYAGQCLLADGDRVVIAPAGPEVLLLCVEARSGREIWRTANPHGLLMSHSSVMKYTLSGVEQYVYCGVGGTTGISLAGEIRWSETSWKPPVVAPSPVQLTSRRLLLCAGYAYGGAILEVEGDAARIVRRWKPAQGVSSEQQTPIVAGGVLFSIMPKDAGRLRQQLLACDAAADTLTILADGSGLPRFGLGPYLLAGERTLLVLDDDGMLSIVDYAPAGFQLLGRHQILPGHDSWGPLAWADRMLLARDLTSLVCLEWPIR